MITKKDLQKKLEEIAAITGEATSEQDAINKGKDMYLHLDHIRSYGGYRVVNVKFKEGYSETGALGGNGMEKRLPTHYMWNKLVSILTGLEIAQTIK